jgi:hypothetical protein
MIIGNPSIFAIESKISIAYEQLNFLALGFFAIHLGNKIYGTRSHDSTMLACSSDAVQQRIAQRGKHIAPFAPDSNAGLVADAFRSAIYGDRQDDQYFGIPAEEFSGYFSQHSADCMWAPDGDEAFDDGSYILQFDINDRVRLIAFRCFEESIYHNPATLSDVWLPADEFYRILQQWHEKFELNWQESPKVES